MTTPHYPSTPTSDQEHNFHPEQPESDLSQSSEIDHTDSGPGSSHSDDDDVAVDEDFESLRSSSAFNVGGNTLYTVHGERSYNNTSWIYRYPCDQEEVLRQDRQHYVMAASLPGLYRGPIERILNDRSRHRRLLDIGCGTGIWLQEMAELFPKVDCIGLDIVPLQHDHRLKNCTFMCVNVPTGLRLFAPYSFDVVHLRQMLHATDEYSELVAEAHRLLRRGGVLLIHEPQLCMYSIWEGFSAEDLAPATTKLLNAIRAALSFRGVKPEIFHEMESTLVDAGFELEDIDTFYHYRHVCPEDPESGYGRTEAENAISFTSAARLMIMEAGVMGDEEFASLLEELSNEVHGRSNGMAGPLGAQGVVSPWGYWWALKRGGQLT